MIGYHKIGEISEGTRQAMMLILDENAHGGWCPEWEHCSGDDRNYECWTVNERIMFVRIPPGGRVDKHRDKPAKGRRTNTVLQTNDQCLNHMGAITQHLEERGIYEFDATEEHWAENNGSVDRIVMVETLP